MTNRTFLCVMFLAMAMFAGCSENKPAGPPKPQGAAEPAASESTTSDAQATDDPKK